MTFETKVEKETSMIVIVTILTVTFEAEVEIIMTVATQLLVLKLTSIILKTSQLGVVDFE